MAAGRCESRRVRSKTVVSGRPISFVVLRRSSVASDQAGFAEDMPRLTAAKQAEKADAVKRGVSEAKP